MKNLLASKLVVASIFLLFSCNSGQNSGPDAFSLPESEKKESTSSSKKKSKKKPAATSSSTPGKGRTRSRAEQLGHYASKNGCSTEYCFLVDMSIPSGRNRFFVYDIEKG